jgi:prepilin-type processing-associated H-X9-DG protein
MPRGAAVWSPSHLSTRGDHPGGVNVAFRDGSVRFIKNNINLAVWKSPGTNIAGEVLDGASY